MKIENPLNYKNVDLELVRFIPELTAPHQKATHQYEDDGHPGQYEIFESMFRCFIEILLNIQKESPEKEDLLKRSFAFIEEMFISRDDAVQDLAWIAMFENLAEWLYALSKDYWGKETSNFLFKNETRLKDYLTTENTVKAEREYIDLYGVREAILTALQADGIGREDIPGISYPMDSEELESLEAAKKTNDGVVYLSCYSTPYVVAPASMISCGEEDLRKLVLNLVQYDRQEPNQEQKTHVYYYRIPLGERVWNMKKGAEEHGRYFGDLWIDRKFMEKGLEKKLRIF
jgi:hypothetical protein